MLLSQPFFFSFLFFCLEGTTAHLLSFSYIICFFSEGYFSKKTKDMCLHIFPLTLLNLAGIIIVNY